MQSLHSRYSAELFGNLSCCSYRCRLVCCTPRLLQAEGMHNLARTARRSTAERRAASLAPCATPKTASSSRVVCALCASGSKQRKQGTARPGAPRLCFRPQRCDACRHCHSPSCYAQSGMVGWPSSADNSKPDKTHCLIQHGQCRMGQATDSAWSHHTPSVWLVSVSRKKRAPAAASAARCPRAPRRLTGVSTDDRPAAVHKTLCYGVPACRLRFCSGGAS